MHLSVAVTLVVAAAATLPVAFSAPIESGSGVAERSFDEELLARGPNLSVIPKQGPPKPWPQPKGKRADVELEDLFAREDFEELLARGPNLSVIPKQGPPKPWPQPKGKRADVELEDLFAREDFEELLARGLTSSKIKPPKGKRVDSELEDLFAREDFDELFAREFLLD